MEAEPKQIDFYVTHDGKAPFEQWLNKLRDRRARARIDTCLARVRLGNLGETRDVGEGVHELKINYDPGYRLYFGNVGASLVLLLCGGDKSTQEADIKRAKEYWSDYKLRAGARGTEERGER
jgi:putative addiction module killer protein